MLLSGAAGLATVVGALALTLHNPQTPPDTNFTPPAAQPLKVASRDGEVGGDGALTGMNAGTMSASVGDRNLGKRPLTYGWQLGRKDGYANIDEALQAYGSATYSAAEPDIAIAVVKSGARFQLYHSIVVRKAAALIRQGRSNDQGRQRRHCN